MGTVFRYVPWYGGASQASLAAVVDMTQGRVNEVINERREVARPDVF